LQASTEELPNLKTHSTVSFVFLFLVVSLPFSADSTPLPNENSSPNARVVISSKADQFAKVLKYGTSSERKSALQEIEKLSTEEFGSLRTLISESLLKEREASMKIAFLRAIGNLKIQESSQGVTELVSDSNEDVARQAVSTLKKLNPPDGWEKIYSRLQTEDFTRNSNLTIALIEALAEMEGGEGAGKFLEDRLKESFNSHEVRSQIALFLGRKKIQSAEVTLQSIAFNEKEPLTLRTYCIHSLGKIGSKSSIPRLREILEEVRNHPSGTDSRKNQMLKVYSLGALVDLGAEEAFQEIVEFTRDDDSFVRFRAIQFLADTGKEEAREILEYKSRKDPSPKIQKYARERLEAWGKQESQP